MVGDRQQAEETRNSVLVAGRRPVADFPNVRLEIIADASTYVMLDRPDHLARVPGPFATA